MASEYEQQELARISDLASQYRSAIYNQYAAGIQNLQSQKENAYAQYDPLRASVNNEYAKGVKTNNENMANLGLTRSGTNLTAQLKLDTERQRGIAGVNAQQAEAERKLQEQINTYMAERDSAIATKEADLYANAYNNISAYNRQLAQMEAQHNYDVEMAKLNQKYERQRQTLDFLYSLAGSTSNNLQQAAFSLGSSVLDRGFDMMSMERQAQLDRQEYANRAAIDYNYDVALQQLKNAYSSSAKSYSGSKGTTSKSSTQKLSGKTIYNVENLGKNAKSLYDTYNTRMQRANETSFTEVRNANANTTLNAIASALNNGQISETEADWLIRLWRLN